MKFPNIKQNSKNSIANHKTKFEIKDEIWPVTFTNVQLRICELTIKGRYFGRGHHF